jgi:hypothetical protein
VGEQQGLGNVHGSVDRFGDGESEASVCIRLKRCGERSAGSQSGPTVLSLDRSKAEENG